MVVMGIRFHQVNIIDRRLFLGNTFGHLIGLVKNIANWQQVCGKVFKEMVKHGMAL